MRRSDLDAQMDGIEKTDVNAKLLLTERDEGGKGGSLARNVGSTAKKTDWNAFTLPGVSVAKRLEIVLFEVYYRPVV
jgi:hypothetical protein